MGEEIPDTCAIVGCLETPAYEVEDELSGGPERFYYCQEHKDEKQDEYGWDDDQIEAL